MEARKRCSRDLFTSSGRATALIDRHFWYTFLQQSMPRLTNTTILLTYTSCFHWRFSGNWQEHFCERNIRWFGPPGHLSLGSDRLNVTVRRTCTVPLWDVQRTFGSWSIQVFLELLTQVPQTKWNIHQYKCKTTKVLADFLECFPFANRIFTMFVAKML